MSRSFVWALSTFLACVTCVGLLACGGGGVTPDANVCRPAARWCF